MGPWMVIFFSLYGFLNGQESKDSIMMEDCCMDGRQRGMENQDCTVLPLISASTTCRIAQEQCCVAVREDINCTNGINMAKDQGACETLFSGSTCEIKTAKMCCDCCLLGKAAQEQGLSCDLTLSVGYQCGLVSRACCQDSFPNTTSPETPEQDNQASNGFGEPLQGDQCKDGARCGQNCRGNGTCVCSQGYKLKPDGQNCEDINECLLGSHHCRPGERCINTLGSYRCQREVSCGTGYELTDSNNCKDIDECETGTHNCAENFECQNTLGSFRCRPKIQCGDGFIQDALGSCIDINECLSRVGPCQPGQMCINTVGSYVCQRNSINCGRGYHLNAEGTRCVDIDECIGPDNPCAGHGCINLVGSYRCECRTGFIFNSITRVCEDINECRHYPGRLCAHKCDNLLGSYKCSCTTGFKLASDGRNCDDLNECESNPCSQECANVYGSYQCYCRRGYQLSDVDGITCEDIDECALPTGGHICSYRCHNTPGSFHCSCPSSGYTLAPNGRSCQDIDECVTGTHTCSETESCFNVQGGFRCLSFECPPNYRRAGETVRVERSDTIRCVKSCQPNDISCVLDPVHSISHTVISMPTFRDFSKPEEIVFLRTMSPAHAPQINSPDIVFDILEGNVQSSFDIVKRVEHGIIVGVVRQVKPLVGPLNLVLKLAMNYVTNGVVSHRNIVNVHVFVSEFWF
ncbi:fibulin-1 isoform X2 [Chanos chanos]|uniref:Fibulin-1 n=1 Tax=Chanos chanos TaxID=29144 RepID=A0A6J2V5B7_CHACN|nr:fibulin-1 isoform X2 [Chanos chanos]